MPTYKALLNRFVEELAEIEIVADTPEQAANIARQHMNDPKLDWTTGDDCKLHAVWGVEDEAGEMVWERQSAPDES